MIKVVSLEQTCFACPSQWEGLTDDGKTVYIRYRNGYFTLGVGQNLNEAVRKTLIEIDLSTEPYDRDRMDGFMDDAEMKALLAPHVVFEEVDNEKNDNHDIVFDVSSDKNSGSEFSGFSSSKNNSFEVSSDDADSGCEPI